MATHERTTPPTNPVIKTPVGFAQPRHQDKGTYVQRWKVLRERNRNLPKIEFGFKNHYSKRQSRNGPTLARSLTLDSMKLPSISTSSVVTAPSTNISGKTGANTIKSTGSGTKKTLSIQDSLEGVKLEKPKEINGALSKSLPNISNAVQQEGRLPNATKHRFEKIAHTKKMTTRKNEPLSKEKDEQLLEQSGIYQLSLSNLPEESESACVSGKNTETPKENVHNSARTRQLLEDDNIGRKSKRKKWKDNCRCMRCEIMKRQFRERDPHYTQWGIYPCQLLSRHKYYDQYFYDSD